MPDAPGYYAQGPEALVANLARRGDRDAFAELVRRRQRWLRNLMRRLCRDAELANDLAQGVFLKAWRRIRTLREPEKFGAWLKRIAINDWMHYQRKNDAGWTVDFDEQDAPVAPAGVTTGIDLDNALATLPARARLCVVLSYHERLTHAEIAELTGISLGTVKSDIRRGSARLREQLAAYGEPA